MSELTAYSAKHIADLMKDKQVLRRSEAINWVGEANQTFIFFRQAGKLLLTNLLAYLKDNMPFTTIVLRPINEAQVKIDGIFLSFIQQEETATHPQIRTTLSNETPKKLLYHLLSQLFSQFEK